jgi:hypothetical protein
MVYLVIFLDLLTLCAEMGAPAVTTVLPHKIHMVGEPNSGTTWLNHIVSTALHYYCDPKKVSKFCKLRALKSSCALLYTVSDEYQVTTDIKFTQCGKHLVPFTNANKGIYANCTHANAHPSNSPCNIQFEHPNLDTEKFRQAFEQCVDFCFDESAFQQDSSKYNISFIYIIRDPRDVVISHCHHLNLNMTFEDCIFDRYPRVLLWIKYREIMLKKSSALLGGMDYVCYEKMGSHNVITDIVDEYEVQGPARNHSNRVRE